MATSTSTSTDNPYTPPRHTIDLSLPPNQRYRALALAYRDRVHDLTSLFDALLLDMTVPQHWLPGINRLSALFLRRVHSPTQTEELRGISSVTNVPMYLLVAFNVILDLLMGCSSGGALTLSPGQSRQDARMLHFRTLDWSMDPLRQVIVQLDFIRSKSADPEKVRASSITYVGFVGVLTGVRQGLSMSLNFRAVHDARSRLQHFRFYLHHLLVLLGRRPSIATVLRGYLFDDCATSSAMVESDKVSDRQSRKLSLRSAKRTDTSIGTAPNLSTLYNSVKGLHTTAAYLTFSDGTSTMCIEKDFSTATMRVSNDFIAITNHDVDNHNLTSNHVKSRAPLADKTATEPVRGLAGLEELFKESKERLDCLSRRWERLVRRRSQPRSGNTAVRYIRPDELRELVEKYPTTNESTHFACVMDPSEGRVRWAVAYPTQEAAMGEGADI